MDLDALNVRRFLEEAVDRNAGETFLVWNDESHPYEEVNSCVDAASRAWHDAGVRKGVRVAFMVDNSPDFLYAWLGLAKLGAILVAINTGFTEGEAGYLVDNSQARFALVDACYGELFQPIWKRSRVLECAFSVGPAEGYEDFRAITAAGRGDVPSVDLHGDDAVSLICTSGTTGRPKGVMQTHRNHVLTGQAYPHWMGMRKGDRIYACLPLFHINSQAYSTMGAIGAEGAIVLAPRFSARRFWVDVRRHKGHYAAGTRVDIGPSTGVGARRS